MTKATTASKKPWIKKRLHELGKSSAGLARHLGVEGPRVYEVTGGRRHIQPNEFQPMAEFLEWDAPTLLEKIPVEERVVNADMRLPDLPFIADDGAKTTVQRMQDLERRVARLERELGL